MKHHAQKTWRYGPNFLNLGTTQTIGEFHSSVAVPLGKSNWYLLDRVTWSQNIYAYCGEKKKSLAAAGN
jgi:hypothetical protein